MVALTDVSIVNNTSSKSFRFRAVGPFKNKKFQPSIDIPLANTSAANRIIFRLSGQQQDVNFQFTLFDDGDDVSDGDSIVTVAQQIDYLMNTIFSEEFDDTWTLSQGKHFATPISGAIDTIDLDQQVGAGTVLTGTFIFKRGRLGGA